MKTPLIDIAMMDFKELSFFVQAATKGEKYIAKPSEASEIDLDVCTEYIINIVITPAMRGEHKRVDSRSHRVHEGDTILAELLSSAALTYWVDRGFIIAKNARISRAISAQITQEEAAEAKADLLNLQIENFGAILEAKKTHFKQGLQACWDFEESDLQIAKRNEGEMMPASYFNTLEAIA